MSSSADPVKTRPAWPWFALAVFFGLVAVGMAFVAANGESLAQQVALVIAFGMFAKYAAASSVTVSLTERDHTLTFAVTDDGRGFDPAATTGGTGLQGMEDRLGAQDGELSVTSSPGCGTTIERCLPLTTAAEVPA